MTTNATAGRKVKRIYTGTVISDKMDKTLVVKSERTYVQEDLSKIIRRIKKYKVHDKDEQAKPGDIIEFSECAPISKTKYMTLEKIVKTAAQE